MASIQSRHISASRRGARAYLQSGMRVGLVMILIAAASGGCRRQSPAATGKGASTRWAEATSQGPADGREPAISQRTAAARGRYYEESLGVSYDPPVDWKIAQFPGLKYRVAYGPASDGFAPNINIVAEAAAGSLDDYVAGNLQTLEKMCKGYKLLARASVETQSGIKGIRCVCLNDQSGRKLRQTYYFFGNGGRKHVVTCTCLADGGEKLDGVFEASMGTLRFHEVPAAREPATDRRTTAAGGRYEDEELGLSYDPPANWEIVDLPGFAHRMARGFADNGFAPNINIVEEAFEGSLDEYADANIRTIERVFKGYKLLNRRPFETQSGVKGIRVVCLGEQAGYKLRQTWYVFGNGTRKYVVTCSCLAEGGEKLDGVFEASMRTLRFHPAATDRQAGAVNQPTD